MAKNILIVMTLLGLLIQSALAADPYNPNSTIPYKVFIFGVEDFDLMRAVEEGSALVKKEDTPPSSISALKKRAEQDLINIQKVVASFGYYDADFDYFVDVRTSPVTVYVKVKLNTQYKIGAFKLKSDPPNNSLIDLLGQDIKKVGISLGDLALRKKVQAATVNTINHLQKHGYPFARLKEDRIIIDRSKKEMQIALLVSPGPLTRFGNTILEENGEVTGEFIKSHMRWRKGEVYSEKKVVDTIQSLNNTRLFREVKITHDDRIDQNGLMNMYLKLESSGKNIFTPEKSYISGLGLELGGSWERRNLFGGNDILKSTVRLGKHRKHLSMKLTAPDVGRLNLNVNSSLSFFQDDLRPYSRTGGVLKFIGDYPLQEYCHIYGGLETEIYRLDLNDRTHKNERFFSLPMGFVFDHTDDAFRPKRGARIKIDFTPYATLLRKFKIFSHLNLSPEVFIPLLKNNDMFLRGWVDMGVSPGAGKTILPRDKRYYGGSGTHEPVRGYAFQMAGPLSGKIPEGGRSALSFGAELHYDITRNWSILSFMDWGTTYDKQFPDFTTKLLWGVGAGMRYRTSYGTFYLDVASPVDRRGKIDNPIEVYAGVKQKT